MDPTLGTGLLGSHRGPPEPSRGTSTHWHSAPTPTRVVCGLNDPIHEVQEQPCVSVS